MHFSWLLCTIMVKPGWSQVSKAKKCWCVEDTRDSWLKVSFLPLASAKDSYKDILSNYGLSLQLTINNVLWQHLVSWHGASGIDFCSQKSALCLFPHFLLHKHILKNFSLLSFLNSPFTRGSIFHGQITIVVLSVLNYGLSGLYFSLMIKKWLD